MPFFADLREDVATICQKDPAARGPLEVHRRPEREIAGGIRRDQDSISRGFFSDDSAFGFHPVPRDQGFLIQDKRRGEIPFLVDGDFHRFGHHRIGEADFGRTRA